MWHKPSKGVMADLRQKSTPDLKFLILSNSYGDTRFSINITLIDMENFILYYSYKSTTSSLHLASLHIWQLLNSHAKCLMIRDFSLYRFIIQSLCEFDFNPSLSNIQRENLILKYKGKLNHIKSLHSKYAPKSKKNLGKNMSNFVTDIQLLVFFNQSNL